MSTNGKTPTRFQKVISGLIGGFTTDPPTSLTSLYVEGTSQKTTQVVAELQAIDARMSAVTTAKTAYELALAARENARAADEGYVNSAVASLKVMFEGDQQQLNAFGIAPPTSRTEPTPLQKVIAAAKAQATREARGTMSKKARSKITAGTAPTVTVSGIVPVAVPASASSSGSTTAVPAVTPAPAGK